MHKLTIDYSPNSGYVLADGQAEQWVDKIIKLFREQIAYGFEDVHHTIKVSSALLVDFFRVRLAAGVLKTHEIEFTFRGKTLEHNEFAQLRTWPKGYCDIPIVPVEQLLTLQAKKAKEKRKQKPIEV